MTDLPAGWCWVQLADVADVQGGIQKQAKRRPVQNKYPFLRVANVQRGRLNLDEVHEVELFDGELARFELRKGDLLVVEGNGSPDQIGRAATWDGSIANCVHQNHLIRVRATAALLPEYLELVWNSPLIARRLREVAGSTSGLYTLSTAKLKSIVLPLPPLAEQRRIVFALARHLSNLAAGEVLCDQAKKRLFKLKEAIFADASEGLISVDARDLVEAGGRRSEVLNSRRALVEEGVRGRPDPLPVSRENEISFPERWSKMSLEEVTHPIRTISYGILKPGPHVPGGVPYVRVINMRGDQLALADLHRTSVEIDAQYARARLVPGDVLVSIRGTYGRVVRVPFELDGANITQDTARLAFLESVDPDFACIYLRSPQFQLHLRKVARGVAVKGVNIGDLREAPFPLPSLAEQRHIVKYVNEQISRQEAVSATVYLAASKAGMLRRQILREAFSGLLEPQDPNDEPASELLAQIRSERAVAPGRQKARNGQSKQELAAPPTRVTGDNYQQEALPL